MTPMFRVGDEFPDRLGKSPYFTQEGRGIRNPCDG